MEEEGEAEEAVAEYVAECEMPTDRGTFRMRSYRCAYTTRHATHVRCGGRWSPSSSTVAHLL